MKAIVQDRYGGPEELRLAEVDRPVAREGEVLVRVVAGSANPRDWHLMRGLPLIARPQIGWRAPKFRFPGSDVAGVVEAIGPGVTRFAPGDEVFANVEEGGFSEYTRVPERILARKPANVTFEEAGVLPLAATTALQLLRHAGVRDGNHVMIVGASGGVGHLALQIAKALGAARVTGVSSTKNLELVRSLGADEVIDYTRDDATRSGPYDVIVQFGGTTSARAFRRALKRKGVLVVSSGEGGGRWVGPMGRFLGAMLLNPFVSQKIGSLTAKANAEDLDTIRTMIEAGRVRPLIERTFALSEVAEAIRLVETAHVRGKLAVVIQPLDSRSGNDSGTDESQRARRTVTASQP
jgi:NADPH:quinone reductase-like Zn-dependent oxidoreductase